MNNPEGISRLTSLIDQARATKSYAGVKQSPVDFFDLTPIWEYELDTYCELKISLLTLKIVRRLAQRSPEDALKALLAAQKKQTCGHCGRRWIDCECPRKENNLSF